jgi:hypothetical protein
MSILTRAVLLADVSHVDPSIITITKNNFSTPAAVSALIIV